jgi:hypothetical protein
VNHIHPVFYLDQEIKSEGSGMTKRKDSSSLKEMQKVLLDHKYFFENQFIEILLDILPVSDAFFLRAGPCDCHKERCGYGNWIYTH